MGAALSKLLRQLYAFRGQVETDKVRCHFPEINQDLENIHYHQDELEYTLTDDDDDSESFHRVNQFEEQNNSTATLQQEANILIAELQEIIAKQQDWSIKRQRLQNKLKEIARSRNEVIRNLLNSLENNQLANLNRLEIANRALNCLENLAQHIADLETFKDVEILNGFSGDNTAVSNQNEASEAGGNQEVLELNSYPNNMDVDPHNELEDSHDNRGEKIPIINAIITQTISNPNNDDNANNHWGMSVLPDQINRQGSRVSSPTVSLSSTNSSTSSATVDTSDDESSYSDSATRRHRRRQRTTTNTNDQKTPKSMADAHGLDTTKTEVSRKKFVCKCGVICKSLKALTRHEEYSIKNGKFKCHLCRKRFLYRGLLSQHLRQTHNLASGSNKGSVGCRRCGEIFTTRLELVSHQRRKHPVLQKSKKTCKPSSANGQTPCSSNSTV